MSEVSDRDGDSADSQDKTGREAGAQHRRRHVITEKVYKTFTVGIDETLDRTIDELKEKFGKTSRADVFRMGIALLKVAAEARERNLKLTISDQNDVVRKEIVLP
jgi:hypothetical protein